MTDARVTRELLEVIEDAAPECRVTRELLEVIEDAAPECRVTRELLEVIEDAAPECRTTRIVLEVAWREGVMANTFPLVRPETSGITRNLSESDTLLLGALDRSTAGALNIGASVATSIVFGSATCSLNIDGSAITIDSAASISIDAAAASNISTTSANLTLSTITAGTLFVTSAALLDIDAAANIDIDVTGSFDMLATNTFSIDGTGASNVSATSGNLTISTITSGVLYLTSAGLLALTDGYKAASTYGANLVLSNAAAEWDTFETNFGEVSILNALNQCASSAVTLDEAYNASAGASTVNVDAGDVTWDISGGYDFVIDIDTGAAEQLHGFIIQDSATTDYFKILVPNPPASLYLLAELQSATFNTESGFSVVAGGPTEISGFSVGITGTNEGVTVNAVSHVLTLKTTTSGTLFVTSAGLLDIDAAANIDIDVTGSFDMLATNTFSIDGTGASNVSATSGNLTISTITSGVLYLTSAGFLAFTDGYKAASGYGTDLVLSDSSDEWDTFETNFGEVSLLNAISQCGPATAGWVTAENSDVDTGTELIDSFTITNAALTCGSCFWTFLANRPATSDISGGTISVTWIGTGYFVSVLYNDDDWTQPVFTITQVDNGATVTISLWATVTDDNWRVQVRRSPYMWSTYSVV